MKLKCALCTGELDTNVKGNFREITGGWGEKRAAGGANAIRMVRWGDEWAHGDCINLETKAGISAHQQRMM